MNELDSLYLKFPRIQRAEIIGSMFFAEALVSEEEISSNSILEEQLAAIQNFVWDSYEKVTNAVYFYSNDGNRFTIDGTLYTVPSKRSSVFTATTLTTQDVFGKFTRFDFDRLTLNDSQEINGILFTVESDLVNVVLGREFKELFLVGMHFEVVERVEKNIACSPKIFEISAMSGMFQ